MTERGTESTTVGSGAPGTLPVPAVSGQSSGEQTSTPSQVDVKALVKEAIAEAKAEFQSLAKTVAEETVEGRWQSTKDKTLSKVRRLDDGLLDAFDEVAKRLRQANPQLTDAQINEAKRDMAIDAFIEAQRLGQAGPAPRQGADTTSQTDTGMSAEKAQDAARRILDKSGLAKEAQDTIVAEWNKKSYTSWAEAFAELTGLTTASVVSASKPPVAPSPSGLVTTASSTTPGGEAQQEKIAALYSELDEAQKHPSATKVRRAEIMKELTTLGALPARS